MKKHYHHDSQPIKSGYEKVNGLDMYYEIHGKGFPLIVIHGGGSTIGTTFGRILPDLAPRAMVVAVEMQAHGHTGDIDRPLSFEQDANDISTLMDALGIENADLLGFSNGGNTVMQVAMKYPQKVRKAIVCSSFYKRDGIYPFVWDFIKNGNLDVMPQGLKDAFLAIRPDPQALQVMHDRDQQRMVTFKDWSDEDLKSIKAETLLVIGDNDIVKPEHAVEMYRLIPKCRLSILPGGHGDYMGEITAYDPASKVLMLFGEVVFGFLG